MTKYEKLKAAIENARPISWVELEEIFCRDRRTIRRWIDSNCPQVKLIKRQRDISPAQARIILEEWMEV